MQIAHRIRPVAIVISILTLAAPLLFLTGATPEPKASEGISSIQAGTPYEIDPAHSTLNYRIRHLGVNYFFGRINMPEGEFLLDANDLANSRVLVSVPIKNMDGGNEGRNKFLTGIDFFNATEFPTAEFKSKSIKSIDAATWEATGDFTLHGVTKTITVKLEEYAAVKTSRFGHRAGFFVSFNIKRSDYGMSNFMDENMLADEVLIFAGIEGAHE